MLLFFERRQNANKRNERERKRERGGGERKGSMAMEEGRPPPLSQKDRKKEARRKTGRMGWNKGRERREGSCVNLLHFLLLLLDTDITFSHERHQCHHLKRERGTGERAGGVRNI